MDVCVHDRIVNKYSRCQERYGLISLAISNFHGIFQWILLFSLKFSDSSDVFIQFHTFIPPPRSNQADDVDFIDFSCFLLLRFSYNQEIVAGD